MLLDFRYNMVLKLYYIFSEYTDEQIWGCLELVKMKNFIEEFPGGLGKHLK